LNKGAIVNVFDLDRALVRDYERFARSFTQIRAPDIRRQVEALYASDRFWPEPLISINPRFERGPTVDRLVAAGSLHPSTAGVFSIDRKPLQLSRHQAQAIAKAATGQSFVVTTGTGSLTLATDWNACRKRFAGSPYWASRAVASKWAWDTNDLPRFDSLFGAD
jgi:hypothetical protein